MLEINEIIKKMGIDEKYIENYGKYKAKVDLKYLENFEKDNNSKLILISAISPSPFGEGKTTTSIGLADALNVLGKNTTLALREPSLGPVFGIKGGAIGGGKSKLYPENDINLHFTGDFHAITSANNLIASVIDNCIFFDTIKFNKDKIIFNRCMDINDRALRKILIGIDSKNLREEKFDITAASEIMAVLALSENLEELEKNLSNIIVGYDIYDNEIKVKDLNISGALCALLKDAIKPNLVQTLEATPAFVHCGPFANIAHGCNSILATKMALKSSEYVVTEAGFGADLGLEKFIDIKSRRYGLDISAVVLVATLRGLKYHGYAKIEDIEKKDMEKLKIGFLNLKKHLDNIKNLFKLNVVVALNKFESDTDEEIDYIINECLKYGVKVVINENYTKGSKGSIDLAKEVINLSEQQNYIEFCYNVNDLLEEKIIKICQKVYGAKKVIFSKNAKNKLNLYQEKYPEFDICMAKNQYSFTDNKDLLDVYSDFEFKITDIKLSAGAKFIVVLSSDIMTMPGLSKNPSANNIYIENGNIVGII